MNTEKTSFELLFEEGLKHYSFLIKYQCRSWSNSKLDEDELFSEASIVLLRILKFHYDLNFKSPHFKNLLMKSIKNRFIDLRRKYYTKSRNQFLEIQWETYYESADESSNEFYNSNFDPAEIVSAKQLLMKLSSSLSNIDQLMLSQLINPSDELIQLATERDQAMSKLNQRRSHGSNTEIPVVLLGDSIGLTYKQSIASLSRIRKNLHKIQ